MSEFRMTVAVILAGSAIGWALCYPLQAGFNVAATVWCRSNPERTLVVNRRSPMGIGEARYCMLNKYVR